MNFFKNVFNFSCSGSKIKRFAEVMYKITVIFGGIIAVLSAIAPLVGLIFIAVESFFTAVLLFVPALLVGAIIGAIIFSSVLFGAWLICLRRKGISAIMDNDG